MQYLDSKTPSLRTCHQKSGAQNVSLTGSYGQKMEVESVGDEGASSSTHKDKDIAAGDDHRQVAQRLEVLHVDEARIAVVDDERVQPARKVLRRRALV